MMGVLPVIGRDFEAAEENQGTAPVAILSYSLWQRRFAGDASVMGRTIVLDGRDFTIVGVLPSDFVAPSKTDVLIPIGVWITNNSEEADERGDRGDMPVIGRLAPGITNKQATSEMEGIESRLAEEYPKVNAGYGVAMQPIRDALVGQTRPALLVLFGAVIFVLLIACETLPICFLYAAPDAPRRWRSAWLWAPAPHVSLRRCLRRAWSYRCSADSSDWGLLSLASAASGD